jgi:hypothetical protein
LRPLKERLFPIPIFLSRKMAGRKMKLGERRDYYFSARHFSAVAHLMELERFLPASGVNAKMRAFVCHTPTQKEEKTDGS